MPDSTTNTAWRPPDSDGARFTIRESVTLADVLCGLGEVVFHNKGSTFASERISFYDNAASDFRSYWFRKNSDASNARWRALDIPDYIDIQTKVGCVTGLIVSIHPFR